MAYTPAMLESIARVEASRGARLSTTFPRLTPEQREDVLRRFHPDYITQASREIRVGACKGDRTPLELAELLEAPAQLDPDTFALDRCDLETDVLIVGGGGAGACAALMASRSGARVLMVTGCASGMPTR
jgi:succinate dehydrogenase / fumarate reductase flavoprotein subunit